MSTQVLRKQVFYIRILRNCVHNGVRREFQTRIEIFSFTKVVMKLKYRKQQVYLISGLRFGFAKKEPQMNEP